MLVKKNELCDLHTHPIFKNKLDNIVVCWIVFFSTNKAVFFKDPVKTIAKMPKPR